MDTRRITYLSALVLAPTVWALACGGSDNPAATSGNNAGTTSSNGGSASGNGGSATGNGGRSSGNGGSATGNGGAATGTGGRGFMLPMEPIVTDPTCPDQTFTIPDSGLPDGAMIPPGLLGDGGTTTLKGCCDQTNFCGVAFVRSFSFMGTTYDFSICATPTDIGMFGGGGIDAGPSKPCTYVAP